ncbi:MAG: rhamnulokinase [Anaerolineae bacterium]|jgi:rhamnulokinase|nr:rhamnulokinase [Anaerolineae bacterium]
MISAGNVYLAVDLGAESGRVVAGHFDGKRIALEPLHRFPNGPVDVQGTLFWDVLRLWSDIKIGLGKAAAEYGDRIVGIGLDTWGVDYGLLGRDGTLLGNPYHYRDSRTDGMMEAAFRRVPRGEVFARTGIQFMQLNTLFQLVAMVEAGSSVLDVAETLLTMPDLINYWLTGRRANEFTIATTTQCYDPRAGDWAYGMLEKLGIPTRLFGAIVPPGTVLGPLQASVAAETGLGAVPVIAPATHDTGSAVAAVPMDPDNAIYLSSGTWSLMGVESKAPIIDDRMLTWNLTNEGGVDGTFRILKNIMGLWLVQECRREWQRTGEDYDYGEMVEMAAAAPAFGPIVSPSDSRFLAPGDMTSRIRAACRDVGQAPPESKGAILRCALESLALEYRWVAERLDELTGKRLGTIHIIGGGAQNELLDQLAADATGRTVVTGPIEATALGNVLVQAKALGHIGSIAEGREVVKASFELKTFEPRDTARWDDVYARYLQIRGE